MPRFPLITHIDQVLPFVEEREDFIVGERRGFTFIDYAVTFPDTFKDPYEPGISEKEQLARLMRQECRGIKFYSNGQLAERPYHKFFNIGEKAWTTVDAVDWDEQFIIMDKLDGSMIHPLWLPNELYFCTRMGVTDIADDALEYAIKSDINYTGFLKRCALHGWTPLFEWCTSDRYKQIVIKHEEDHLVLTGVRYKTTGVYMDYVTMKIIAGEYNVPVVQQWEGDWKGILRFLDDTKQIVGAEGYVLSFKDEKYKTKGEWYLAIHRAKDAIQFEKDVVSLIIERKVDDVLPELLEDDRRRMERFHSDFWDAVLRNNLKIQEQVTQIVDECPHDTIGPRKRWIAERIKADFREPNRGLAFAFFNGRNMTDYVIKILRLKVGSGPKLRETSALFGGINWLNY